ncbi:MAG: response regulator transcription factor [Marinosulfonomonas sp.]|nr:response regulator transcription factor [Marinosulfonomonas sp.]
MKGYSSGADDYVAKPFNPDLLLARIQAVVRRTQRSASLSYRRTTKNYSFGKWSFDARSGQLLAKDGFEVVLSRLEVSLLKILLANPFIPLTREEIASVLSSDREPLNTSENAEGRAVDVLVGRLRSKLEEHPKNPAIIKTIRGTGYVLSVEVSTSDE